MKFIIGKKQEMTQIWRETKVYSVTKVKTGSCVVVQKKTEESDGYSALQVGFGTRKEKNINKPQKKHFGKLGNFAKLREFRTEVEDIKRGDVINIGTFNEGDTVQVTSTSKGKGFQGVVKRWGFAGQIKTHGNKDQLRMPGSIGATGPAHVFKGTKMGGRMGGDRTTIKNLEVIKVDEENNILYIKGAIPGARNGLVLISGEGELKFEKGEEAPKEKEEKEEKDTKEQKEEKKEEKVEKKPVQQEAGKEEAPEKAKEKREEDIEEVVVEADKKKKSSKKEEVEKEDSSKKEEKK